MKDLVQLLKSIDYSLQIIASASTGKKLTISFVDKKTMATRLSMSTIAVDKLIHQGIASKGQSGLVEGIHYCRPDPSEQNTSNFLFDPASILRDAWSSFQNVGKD